MGDAYNFQAEQDKKESLVHTLFSLDQLGFHSHTQVAKQFYVLKN